MHDQRAHPSPPIESLVFMSPGSQVPADGAGSEDGTEDQYLAWLARQYAHFQRSLFGLLHLSRPDIVQVSCALLLIGPAPTAAFWVLEGSSLELAAGSVCSTNRCRPTLS